MGSGIDGDQLGGRERRCDRQPGLCLAAEQFCSTDLTDGFCSPKQRDVCKCWDRAEQSMRGTGLSAQAVAWVYAHRHRIEEEAEKWYRGGMVRPPSTTARQK